MGQLYVWKGDILGGDEVTCTPLPGANPLERGYLATQYIFIPNPLQGSLVLPKGLYLASDCFNPAKNAKEPGPCSCFGV